MKHGIGFGAERLGLAALRWPKSVALLTLLFLLAVGASLPHLRFDEDIHRVFLSDSPLSNAQRQYEAEQTPPVSTQVVLVQSQAPFTAAQMERLRAISLDLEFLDGVAGVASPFVLRAPPGAGAPNGRPVFADQISPDYQQDIARFRALGTGLPTFLNPSATALLMAVSVDLDQASVRAVIPQIDAEFTRSLPTGLTHRLTGEDAISLEIVDGLKGDLLSLNLWGGLLVAVAAFVFLRDMRMALLAVVPALCGAASVLALSVWLGFPVTVLSNVIPILMLVLGVADGVHLTDHLKTSGNDIAETLRQIGPACALTALTTAVAFASVMATDNAQLFEFALLGALGTLLAFATTLTVFALLAQVVRVSPVIRPHPATRCATALAAAASARPLPIIVVSLVLLGLSTVGYLQTKPWFPLYQNLPDGSPTLAANDSIAAEFGGVFQMIVETNGSWSGLQTLTASLADLAGPEAVVSQASIARWLGTPDSPPTTAQLETFPKGLIDRLQPADPLQRVFVSIAEPMRSQDALARFDALYNVATANGATQILGLPTVMRQEAVTLIAQLSRGLVVASVGATLVAALAFGALRMVPVLLIPNILPLMLTGASLHLWAQGELTPTAVLALTIAFGIAIDDTIHFLNRFAEARGRGLPTQQAIHAAAAAAGRVMILTTAVLSVGLCITFASDFTPIRLFGGMMITTLWAALLVDLLLLPALLARQGRADASC